MMLVSLLLMTFNCEDVIETTLKSIEKQDYPEIELVISDGGSQDRTLEILRKYASVSKYRYDLVSEKDHGLYDALNKDVARARGDFLMVMNDQLLSEDAVSKLVRAAMSGPYDGAHSDLVYATDEQVVRYWHMGKGRIRSGWLPGHPTLLLRRSVYEKYGDYKTSYKSAADYEFMIRILSRGEVSLAYVPEILVRMYYGGTSTGSTDQYLRSLREGHQALKENKVRCAWMVDVLRTLRVLRQFLVPAKVKAMWKMAGG